MPIANEFQQVSPNAFVWHYYDPSVKTELWSTSIAGPTGLFFIDPIPLAKSVLVELCQQRPPAGVIVTNVNHTRAAAQYSGEFAIPIFSGSDKSANLPADFEKIVINRAVAEEIAVFETQSGTLIVGDALINFEPQGFAFLPKKYCLNEREMRRSLRQLLNFKIERIFFAHGPPILVRAAEKLQALLES